MRIKIKQRNQKHKQRSQTRRGRATSLLAIGSMGAMVAYTAVGGKGVVPAEAGWVNVFETVVRPAAQGAVHQFNIAPGVLDDVIDAFEETTGVEITLSQAGLAELMSPGVRGQYSVDQALAQILEGTGVTFRYAAQNAVVLDLQVAEFIEVVDTAPQRVTSPKFTETLVNTPQSIAVIPGELFLEQGVRNLTEVLRNTPGITFDAGENGFATGTSSFSLRGFDTSGSVFIDGARDSGNYFRDVFNVEQVEIAKGPAGDNGRSSAGGYVNLATKSPLPEGFQRASFSYGFDEYDSGNRPRITLDLNQPVSDGTSLRLNALWQEGGAPGRARTENNSWGLAPSAAFGLNGSTRFFISYQHLEQNNLPDWGVPGALIEGMITYNAAAAGENNRDRFYGHVSDYDDVSSGAATARIEHDFASGLRLSNQTRWSKTEREALYALPTGFNAATGLATTQRQGFYRDNTALSNLTSLTATFATGALPHALSTGLEFSLEESSANRYPTNGVLGNPGSTPIGSPDSNRALAGFVGLNPIQTADVDIDTVAAYVYDTVQLAEAWQITGGLRVERYGVELASKTAAGAPQGPDGYERSDTTVSGKAGLVYKPTPDGSFYAAVGVATLPPASYLSNSDISRDGDNAFPGWNAGPNSATAEVQRSVNYELGTKWNAYNERLSANAALFRTERSNIAMAGTIDGVPNTFAGYGRQIVQGVELSATGQITSGWSVLGGVLFMDSERRHSALVDAARAAANPGDYGDRTTTSGDELAFTPNVTANLWTTYRLPVGLTFGGGFQHVGESYLGRPDNAERIIPNGRAGILPSHTVLDLMAAYEVNRNLTLRFNIDNVTDAFYAVSSNWPGSRVFLGPARSFRVSTDFNF